MLTTLVTGGEPLAKSARKTTSTASKRDMPTVNTSGEVFPDGSAIELIGSADGESLALLRWDGERATIASEILHGGRLYRPLDLHASIRRAIRLPKKAADSGIPGALFREVSGLFEDYLGVSADEAFLAASWNATSWFVDCLPNPPPLLVSGSDLGQAIKLFKLIRCLCRRGLILAEVTRSALESLPMELRPTMMIAQPKLSDRLWSLLGASNYRGSYISGRRGVVLDLVSSRALFMGINGTSRWTDNAIHLALPPVRSNLARLDGREEEKIADRFLPQFLRYRLDHLQTVRESSSAESEVKFSTGELARDLRLCVPDEPDVTHGLVRGLDMQKEDRMQRRFCDPNLAIIEVLWTELQEPPIEISIEDLANSTNSLLRSRGVTCCFSPEEVGWKLKQMGFHRDKKRDHMVLQFSRDTSQRVHYLVETFGLDFPPHPNTCVHCAKRQVVDG
jgi:hypothetical protein